MNQDRRPTENEIVALARGVARELAGPAAADVDRNARFPTEATGSIAGSSPPAWDGRQQP